MRGSTLSLEEARRMALAAQGFGAPRGTATPRALAAAIERLGALQIDSVNVLVRSQYLPLFARLGPYRREMLDKLAYGRRRALFEYWGHECSLLPIATYPLFRFRRERAAKGVGIYRSLARLAREKPALLTRIEREVRERGPLGAGDLADRPRSSGGWWGWSEHKQALEYLFWAGRLAIAARRNFERLYDVAERVIPERLLADRTLDDASQQRALVARAASALGVATAAALARYFRLASGEAHERIRELVDDGTLREVRVEGWDKPAYLARGARAPSAIGAAALLSPFDSLIWDRARLERLFGFHYRISFYTPPHLRTHGYYVMPFILGDRLVARADLKSDRAARALLLRGLHLEPHARRREVMPALDEELARMAAWLDLDRVVVSTPTAAALG